MKTKIDYKLLEKLYIKDKFSVLKTSKILGLSQGKVHYYLKKKGLVRPSTYKYKLNLIGFESYDLKVLELTNIIRNKQKIWKCQCKCGNICHFAAYEIHKGYAKSCGCSKYKSGSNSHRWKGYGEIPKNLWNRIMKGAKDRNLEFNITIEYLWDLFLKQDRKCALSGINIVFMKSHKDKNTASLDRIDSSKGYIEQNIQWVHKDINQIKWAFTSDQLIKYCKMIVDYNK